MCRQYVYVYREIYVPAVFIWKKLVESVCRKPTRERGKGLRQDINKDDNDTYIYTCISTEIYM